MRLKNRVAVVTGGTAEMGAAIGRRYAEEGAKIVLCSRTTEKGERNAREITASGGEAIFVAADLSREADAKNVIATAAKRYGRVDILVNVAAPTTEVKGGMDKPVAEQPFEDFEYLLKVGLYGPYWMSKYALIEMVKNPGGVIIYISSIAASMGIRGIPGYSVGKAGLEALTRQIATDYSNKNIRAVALRLGWIQSNDLNRALAHHPVAGPMVRNMHMTRPGTPEDVAGICAYLASDEAEYVSGQVWPFDGGAGAKAAAPDMTAAYKDIMASGKVKL